jgi:hypothetical protein
VRAIVALRGDEDGRYAGRQPAREADEQLDLARLPPRKEMPRRRQNILIKVISRVETCVALTPTSGSGGVTLIWRRSLEVAARAHRAAKTVIPKLDARSGVTMIWMVTAITCGVTVRIGLGASKFDRRVSLLLSVARAVVRERAVHCLRATPYAALCHCQILLFRGRGCFTPCGQLWLFAPARANGFDGRAHRPPAPP